MITENTPEWLMDGLKTVGGVLPVMGVGILLHYPSTRQYIPHLLLGFFLAAYLQVPILGVLIVGVIAAITVLKRDNGRAEHPTVTATSNGTFGGGYDGDE